MRNILYSNVMERTLLTFSCSATEFYDGKAQKKRFDATVLTLSQSTVYGWKSALTG